MGFHALPGAVAPPLKSVIFLGFLLVLFIVLFAEVSPLLAADIQASSSGFVN